MQKSLVVTVTVMALAASSAMGALSGSKHDFSGASWNTTTTEYCAPCHTPHSGGTDAPLWNHATTTQTFDLYDSTVSATLDATVGQPSASSKACLSCHDGVTAVDSYGGSTGSQLIAGTAPGYVGIDLSDDHPVSFTYNAALATADGGLHDPTTTASGIAGSTGHIDDDMLRGGSKDQLECASCHEPHNNGAADTKMLVKSNDSSALCLTCHNK